MKEEKIGNFDKWEVENALETLQRAEEIKKKEELMKKIQKLAKIKVKQINSIADLRGIANGTIEKDSDDKE